MGEPRSHDGYKALIRNKDDREPKVVRFLMPPISRIVDQAKARLAKANMDKPKFTPRKTICKDGIASHPTSE